MRTVLAYTSPARGHLNPMMGPLLELRDRGFRVHVRTLSAGVDAVRATGLECEPIDPRIEAIVLDDHRERSQVSAAKRSQEVWGERAPLDARDFRAAVAQVQPDLCLVDTSTLGARAAAEADGLTWAESRPFLLPDRAPGVPPFGLGLRPRSGPAGRVRDGLLGRVADRFLRTAHLPAVDAGRRAAGLGPLADVRDSFFRAPLMLYFTAFPFEYERAFPPTVVMVGAATWDPEEQVEIRLPQDDRPLALVACSSEFQDDAAIARAALAGLTGGYRVVVTSAGVDPAQLEPRGGAIVERFLAHRPLLEQADVVVCHGGMGITQKALAHGVPVCVVPWGRDQLDVAAHVEEAGAGVRLSRRRLSPRRLADAAERARACAAGAERVRTGYERTGGAGAAADALERLLRGAVSRAGPGTTPCAADSPAG